ncbi:MAG: HAMP domain-containing sensor histidine kinase [Fulvivirga sp.]
MIIEQSTLKNEKDQLGQLNEILDNFVYSCSHDLKGPLASIQGLVKLAEKSSQMDAKKECMSLINESVTRMDNFLKSLESYVGNARSPVLRNSVDFNQLVNDIIDRNRTNIVERDVKVNLRLKQPVDFRSDDVRIRLILSNVIENAIHFQDKKKTDKFIDIEININNDTAHIEICDNGEGICRENYDQIYNMFFRASAASKGSGMGLFLAKEAVDKLSGSIEFVSSKGAGSNFVIQIPNHKI